MKRALLSIFTLSFLVVQAVLGQAQIYEIRIDQTSTDNDEYFELAGVASTDLTGLTYIVIGDVGATDDGVIEEATDLTGQTIPVSGFFVAAEATFTLGTADLTTTLSFENGDNVTHMLVSGFTGSSGDDLDTNDDGVLDVTPWSSIVDCIALVETVGSGDEIYCGDTIGPDGSDVPAHIYWSGSGYNIGAFDIVGGDDTPGSENNLPVELASFDATLSGSVVSLTWETLSETDNLGFEVQVSDANSDWEKVSFVEGLGTSTTGRTYSQDVTDLTSGTFTFRLKQIDLDGTYSYSADVEVTIEVVGTHVLADAYPNPFNPSTTIGFAVSSEQHVTVEVYNLVGQRLTTLFDGPVAADQSVSVIFNADNLTSGVYLYRITGETFTVSRQVVLLK